VFILASTSDTHEIVVSMTISVLHIKASDIVLTIFHNDELACNENEMNVKKTEAVEIYRVPPPPPKKKLPISILLMLN